MRPARGRILRDVLVWTLLLVVAAVVVAVQATWSLYSGAQSCFFNFPSVQCPGGDDPAVMRLTFAFFGIPAVWLVGIVFAGLLWGLAPRNEPRR